MPTLFIRSNFNFKNEDKLYPLLELNRRRSPMKLVRCFSYSKAASVKVSLFDSMAILDYYDRSKTTTKEN